MEAIALFLLIVVTAALISFLFSLNEKEREFEKKVFLFVDYETKQIWQKKAIKCKINAWVAFLYSAISLVVIFLHMNFLQQDGLHQLILMIFVSTSAISAVFGAKSIQFFKKINVLL